MKSIILGNTTTSEPPQYMISAMSDNLTWSAERTLLPPQAGKCSVWSSWERIAARHGRNSELRQKMPAPAHLQRSARALSEFYWYDPIFLLNRVKVHIQSAAELELAKKSLMVTPIVLV